MNSFSRGKRMVELSLSRQNKFWKKQSKQDTAVEDTTAADISVLNISNSELMVIPENLDISFSLGEDLHVPMTNEKTRNRKLTELEPIDSRLKVANFILNLQQEDIENIENNEIYAKMNMPRFSNEPTELRYSEGQEPQENQNSPYANDKNGIEDNAIVSEAAGELKLDVEQNNKNNDKFENIMNVNAIMKEDTGEPVEKDGQDDQEAEKRIRNNSENELDNNIHVILIANVDGDTGQLVGEDGPGGQEAENMSEDKGSENKNSFENASNVNNAASEDAGDVRQNIHAGQEVQIQEGANIVEEKEEEEEEEDIVGDSTRIRNKSKKGELGKKEKKRTQRERGQPYTGRKFDKQLKKFVEVEKPAKSLGDRCQCKAARYHCTELSDEERIKIHEDIWNMSWEQKKTFVRVSIECHEPKERTTGSEVSRRGTTLKYTLQGSNSRLRVCKQMFLNTTGLTQWWVLNCLSTSDKPMEKVKEALPSEGLQYIQSYLTKLPKMPSHYCRKRTAKMYLEPSFNSYSDVYREYVKECNKEEKCPLSRPVFMKELKNMNIDIFLPRKDKCDTCCMYEVGNTNEQTYLTHRRRKEAAQEQKTIDKESAMLAGSRHKVICMDVQRVLLSPALKASAIYYKTKLQVHNFTIYDLNSRDTVCYLWNECEGGLSSNEFASCLFHYLESESCNFDMCTIFSDGCTYQNRNHVLSTALRHFSTTHKKTVSQKILERGHTQMEVDSVHATIERRLKNVDIYCPTDYINVIKSARIKPQPYKVKYLDHTFFKKYDTFGNLKSIKPGKRPNDPNVTDLRALLYAPDGKISYKIDFQNEWTELPLGRRDMIPQGAPGQMFSSRRKVKETKFAHLQSLKAVLPADVHGFYDSLPH